MIKYICIIQLVFIALKITERTRWSWEVVASPTVLTVLLLFVAWINERFGNGAR